MWKNFSIYFSIFFINKGDEGFEKEFCSNFNFEKFFPIWTFLLIYKFWIFIFDGVLFLICIVLNVWLFDIFWTLLIKDSSFKFSCSGSTLINNSLTNICL